LRVRASDVKRPSRYFALIIVGVVHVLVVLALRIELGVKARGEESSQSTTPLIVTFLELVEPEESAPSPASSSTRSLPAPAPRPNERVASSAIRQPATAPASHSPPPEVDWDMELKRSAQAMLDRAEEQARHDDAFARRGEVPESLRAPKAPEGKDFSWSYRADRFDPKSASVRISERCTLIVGIIPICQLGKLPVRTDLFADMRKPKSADELDVPRSRSLENVDRQTRHILEAVSRLLGEYRVAHGDYPQDLTDVIAQAGDVRADTAPRVQIVDTWDRKLVYNHPPTRLATCEYDLYSVGPNGVDDQGQRDDIVLCGSTRELRF
jgi:hypothetical protein